MIRWLTITALSLLFIPGFRTKSPDAWIRINQLGYQPSNVKVAVWCSKGDQKLTAFQLVDASTHKVVFSAPVAKAYGAYGPFTQTARLNFSKYQKPGKYYLEAGGARSPEFEIGNDVYKGTADFCLRYMRQQRCGFNPFLKDSCHTHDGYTVYGPPPSDSLLQNPDVKEGMHIDATGGWHDASDYLQYVTTSANAAYHLYMAYRDFKPVFGDQHQSNGLKGKNGIADVLDEAEWGTQWLIKMNPSSGIMFNQIADDRDHRGFRIPKEDSFYGRGYERPVYFITGEPQGLFQYTNRTTGTSSTAAKVASVFAIASYIQRSVQKNNRLANDYLGKVLDAFSFALKKPGVTQTAPGKAPYFYEEDNWHDDLELAYASIHQMNQLNGSGEKNEYFKQMAFAEAQLEPVTPWLGEDTAKHYQWYPFINLGHYELAKILSKKSADNLLKRDTIIDYYRRGIRLVQQKAAGNAFLRGVPFIWCSNNLTVSFTIQCYWYRQLTGSKEFEELEQANFDWLFGCNPWGTSMVYGLPSWGDTPVDPHSAFTHLKNYPIDGGLVDGPVYGSIYNNLKGIRIYSEDEYASFQSNLAVYHDDYGDYSTNEPTMDGTASLVYLLAAKEWGYKKIGPVRY
jgi:hypothetical protein